jgi:polar amino acid transport system substrate-binding protein
MTKHFARRAGIVLAAFATTAVVLTGCTASATPSAGPNPYGVKKVASIASTVPSSVKTAGSVSVAADASYAPDEFFGSDNKTIIGMGADLGHSIGAILGVNYDMQNVTFDSIIPGLASHKYDLAISSMTDNVDRQKTVTFVDYFNAGTQFVVLTAGGPSIKTLDDLCGLSVATERGTTEQTDATTQSKKCVADGKPAIKLLTFPDQSEVNLALSNGRATVMMADSPVTAYQAKLSKGKFKLEGEYGVTPYGIAFPKDSKMIKPTLAAVQSLIDSGVYTKILTKWGLQSGAITTAAINGATS